MTIAGLESSRTAEGVWSADELAAVDREAIRIGREIFAKVHRDRPRFWQRQWWDERIMHWAMSDESLKVQLFRLVDVLPMLGNSDAVAQHVQEYLGEVRDRLPWPLRVGLRSTRPGTLVGRAVARAGRANAVGQARRFIAGQEPHEVLKAAAAERQVRRAFTLDLLGEAVTSEAEADRYLDAYLRLIAEIAPTVNAWPEVVQIDRERDRALRA